MKRQGILRLAALCAVLALSGCKFLADEFGYVNRPPPPSAHGAEAEAEAGGRP